jgi:hypothetical protein
MVYRGPGFARKTTSPPDVTGTATDIIRRPDSSIFVQGTYPTTLKHFNAEIVYTYSPKGESPKKSNMCRHQIVNYSAEPTTLHGLYTVTPGYTYEIGSAINYGAASYQLVFDAFDSSVSNAGFGVLGANGQGYANDAFYALKPDMTELSIPNFLLELDDLPRMFQLWKSNLSLMRNLANARLNWSFGWKPFVGDLEAIRSVLRSVLQKTIEWNKKAGTLLRKSHAFAPLDAVKTGSFTYSAGAYSVSWTAHRTARVHAYQRFKTLRIPELRDAERVIRSLLDSLGFELNPRIIWDAIPFSFVLDWFFDVGSWLQRFKADTLELPVVLDDSCVQYKESVTVDWTVTYTGSGYNPPLSRKFSATRLTFHRLPIFPDQSAATAVGWKIPTVNQLINLISLGTVLRR